jgi:hypothetical protein
MPHFPRQRGARAAQSGPARRRCTRSGWHPGTARSQYLWVMTACRSSPMLRLDRWPVAQAVRSAGLPGCVAARQGMRCSSVPTAARTRPRVRCRYDFRLRTQGEAMTRSDRLQRLDSFHPRERAGTTPVGPFWRLDASEFAALSWTPAKPRVSAAESPAPRLGRSGGGMRILHHRTTRHFISLFVGCRCGARFLHRLDRPAIACLQCGRRDDLRRIFGKLRAAREAQRLRKRRVAKIRAAAPSVWARLPAGACLE